FGMEAAHVSEPADLAGALRRALAADGPYFLDLATESPITETPPVAAWTAAEERRRVGAEA
ncbi:MAG: hypothetical protein KC432_01810, partial [Thermomicrobiales bacterium]|nr:hypothetical protein [Thermomicrobiales bacterium]